MKLRQSKNTNSPPYIHPNGSPTKRPRRKLRRGVRWALMAAMAVAVCFSVWKLADYARAYSLSRYEAALLRDAYYGTGQESDAGLEGRENGSTEQENSQNAETAEQNAAAASEAVSGSLPSVSPTPSPALAAASAPNQGLPEALLPLTTLPPAVYPGNRNKVVTERFARLRRQNADIVGWLQIDGALDQAVVQRDNSYYLRRDYLGYHNQNGAIFLDEHCNLDNRPYEYLLYGHNMKTGEMFGSLRSYEKLSFYREHAVITFDTMYEPGQYVVFSVATVSTNRGLTNYAPIALLPYCTIGDREDCIEKLKQLSLLHIPVDVAAEDQLLLLITCDGNDNERRVVAARRLREDETPESLRKITDRAYVKN